MQRPTSNTTKARLSTAAIFAVVALLAFAFQNCSQPTTPDSSAQTANQKLESEMDFSYDSSIDQMTYMSCPALTGNYDTDMLYSFRVGAYRQGGIKLKDAFFSSYKKKTPDRMIDLLANSTANANTVLQVAVRQVGTLNSVVSGSGTPKKGVDYANMLVQLGNNEMSTWLVNKGLDTVKNAPTGYRTKLMRDGTVRGAHMEATMHFGSSESVATDLRENFLNSGRALLAMTYVQPDEAGSSDYNVRAPATIWPDSYKNDPGVAYGKGFQLTFAKPAGAKGLQDRDTLGNLTNPAKETASYPLNLLTGVSERNLYSGETTTIGSWVCPATLQFKIVRPEDLTDANCARGPDPDPTVMTPEQIIVRNNIRYEDWYIDWAHKCIIPKKTGSSCYGDLHYVQYDTSNIDGCDRLSTTSSNSMKSKVCVAYASVCYRTN